MPSTLTSGFTAADAASCLPRKTFECQYKSDDETGEFTLYAAVFGNVDRQGDIIEKGAFTNLDEFVKDGWIALNHDQSALPMGLIKSAGQDEHGLRITGIWHTTQAAQDCRRIVRERMAAGKAVKCSIGYLVPPDGERYERVDGRMVRHINKLSAYEASFVNLAANNEAEVVSAKSASGSDPFILDGFEEEDFMATEQGVVEALKRALGLSTKGGRKMSGATLEKMKGFCKSMGEHAEKCFGHAKTLNEHAKALKAFGEEHKARAEEFEKCLKDFEGGKLERDEEGDVEENDDDSDEQEPKSRKSIKGKETDTDDANPPKRKRGKVMSEDEDGENIEREKRRKRRKEDDEDEDKEEDEEEEKALDAYRTKLRREALSVQHQNLNGGHYGE